MNSTLQAFRAVPELKAALIRYGSSGAPAAGAGADPEHMVTSHLGKLMLELDHSASPITPMMFTTVFRSSFAQFAERNSEGAWAQQDADECLQALIQAMAHKLGPTAATVAPASSAPPSVIDAIFGGTMATSMRCAESDEESERKTVEPFRKLRCHIDAKTSFLIEGMQADLTNEMEMRSAVLGRSAIWKKRSAVASLPRYLLVQFVRFDWKSDGAPTQTLTCARPGAYEQRSPSLPTVCWLRVRLSAHRRGALANDAALHPLPSPCLRRDARPLTCTAFVVMCAACRSLHGACDGQRDTQKKAKVLRKVEFPLRFDISDLCAPSLKRSLLAARRVLKDEEDSKKGLTSLNRSKNIQAIRERAKERDREAREGKEEKKDATGVAAMDVVEDLAGVALEPTTTSGFYDLLAVITHKGRYADSGHYIGWSKADGAKDSDRWWKYDDDVVSEVKSDDIRALSGGGDHHMAYLLLFKLDQDFVGRDLVQEAAATKEDVKATPEEAKAAPPSSLS